MVVEDSRLLLLSSPHHDAVHQVQGAFSRLPGVLNVPRSLIITRHVRAH